MIKLPLNEIQTKHLTYVLACCEGEVFDKLLQEYCLHNADTQEQREELFYNFKLNISNMRLDIKHKWREYDKKQQKLKDKQNS